MTDEREAAAALAERWLAEAYELVERGWSQGATARDRDGNPIDPDADTASAWSPSGALVRAWRRSNGLDDVLALSALGRANLALTAAMKSVPRVWNDAPTRRRVDVLEAIARAVSLVRAGEEHPAHVVAIPAPAAAIGGAA